MKDFILIFIRHNKKLETVMYFLFSRIKFSLRNLNAAYNTTLINLLKKSILKKDIVGLRLLGDRVILDLNNSSQFYWQPSDRNSLLGLGLDGEWEKEDTDYITTLIKKGNIVFDIGANYGYHTVLFSKLVGKKGEVHSFEPLKAAFILLQKNIDLNTLDRNIHLNKSGLGDKKGYFSIYTYDELGLGASSLRKRWMGKVIEEKCTVETLDNYMDRRKITKLDFVKCDIEGGELAVLKGATKTLKKQRPKLMLEITNALESFNSSKEEVFDFLTVYKYNLYRTNKNKLIKLTKKNISQFHGNAICLPYDQ